MNKFPSIDKKAWKTTIKALTIPLKVSVFIVLFPIKLTHHSVKSGVDYVFNVLVKPRRTLLSENFHTPMDSFHCWLYEAV